MKRAAALTAVLATACSMLMAASDRAAARPSGINDHPLNDIVAIAADDAWAVGNGGLASHWDGGHWRSQHLGGIHTPDLNGVAASSTEDVWAVGGVIVQDAFRGFATRWDGTRWQRAPVPGYPGEMILEDVTIGAPDDAWAIGRYFNTTPAERHRGALLIHWNGSRWTRVVRLPDTTFVAVASPKPDRVLVLAQRGGLLWLITGTSGVWRTVIVPTPTGARCAGGDVDAAPAVVVGVCRSGDRASPFIAERRSNGTWSSASLQMEGYLSGVDLGAATWAVGRSTATGQPAILRRGHAGTWFRVPAPEFPIGASLRAVSSRTFNNAWAVGARPFAQGAIVQPLALHWDGTAWSRVPVPYA